jgi:hypothetical protein
LTQRNHRNGQEVQDLLLAMLKWGNAERIEVTEEALALQQAYMNAGIVVQKYADDALHVAHATIARADVIVSWNFKHLVNPAKIRSFNGINLANGYGMMIILSPETVVMMEEKENETE